MVGCMKRNLTTNFMKEEWEHVNYGIGNTIIEAFEDFKLRKL